MGMPQYMDMQMFRNNAVSFDANFSEQLNSSAVAISGPTGQHDQHYNISLFLSCLYITFLFPVGFFGNILILVVNLSHRSPMKAPDLYFVNLAAADLVLVADSLIEVFNLSSHYYDMAALCTFMTLFLQVNMYSSIFFLTWMSFDRFVVLSGSVHLGRSMPRARLSSCLVWVSSALLTLLPFAMVQAQHAGELNFCFANVSQIQWLGVTLGFLVPFCVLGVCYWRIACLLARAQREHSELRNQPRRQKALRMLSAAVMVFFICWLPENVFISVHLLRGEADGDTLWHDYPLTAHIVSLAAFSNSCLNPLVYSFLGETFQDKLRLFVKKRSWSKLHSSFLGNSPNLRVSIPSSHPDSCKGSCKSTQCLQCSNRLHRTDTNFSNSNLPQVLHHPYIP